MRHLKPQRDVSESELRRMRARARVVLRPRAVFRWRMGTDRSPQLRRCAGCRCDFFDNPGPVLVDVLWRSVCDDWQDRLCDRCIRSRLGRPIMLWDITRCPWNVAWAHGTLPCHTYWHGPLLGSGRRQVLAADSVIIAHEFAQRIEDAKTGVITRERLDRCYSIAVSRGNKGYNEDGTHRGFSWTHQLIEHPRLTFVDHFILEREDSGSRTYMVDGVAVPDVDAAIAILNRGRS